MPHNKSLVHALIWVPLAALSLSLAGCAGPATDGSNLEAPHASDDAIDAGPQSSDADIDALLDIERMGVAVLSDQWVNNDCSVELALSPEDLVCATVLDGADLTTTYDELGGGLDGLTGPGGDAVRIAFEQSRDAGEAWNAAGCADEFDETCVDEAERLVDTLIALDAAFDDWAA